LKTLWAGDTVKGWQYMVDDQCVLLCNALKVKEESLNLILPFDGFDVL